MQAWIVGPGLGTGQTGRDVLAEVLADGVPTCVDADGITLLRQLRDLQPALPGLAFFRGHAVWNGEDVTSGGLVLADD